MPAVDVQIDPEFASLIPPLSPDERQLLKASLAAEGLRDALVVWKEKQLLLDGHNRWGLCKELGIELRFEFRSFPNREAARDFILHTQLGRRNLSPQAASYLRGKRYLEMRHQGVKRQGAATVRERSTSGHNDQKTAAQQLAEEYKVGEKTVRRDAKFAQAVDAVVSVCGDEARSVLLSRQVRVSRWQLVKLAAMPPRRQKRVLAFLAEHGRFPRERKDNDDALTITLPREPAKFVRKLFQRLGAKRAARIGKLIEAEARERGSRQRPVNFNYRRNAR